MRPETIHRLDALFREDPILVGGAVPESEITAAEQRLGRPFDPDHRDFIRRYGGATIGSLPVYGLRRAEVMGDEEGTVLDTTTRFRRDRWPGTDRWLVISMDLAGNPIGLDSDGTVWLSDHDAGDVVQVAATFEAFLVGLLDASAGPETTP